MSQPIETTRQQITEKALSLADAAAHLGWSWRTLIRALVRHGIPTIGSGRRARLEMADLELLKAKERGLSGISSAPQEPARTVGLRLPAGARIDERARVYWRRRLGQLNRKKREPSQVKVGLALILLWAAAVEAFAQTDSDINGKRTSHGFAVSDGDTVKFGRQIIRLFGIDAPEKLQPCDDGKWFPGPLATEALVRIIAGRPVSCRQVDYDGKNNRPVAQCYAGDDDLQEQMVLAGWAWAYTPYSDRYAPEEKDAMARKVGVHAHRCQPPWEWRAQHR